MKHATLFVDGRVVDRKTYSGDMCDASVLARAAIDFGVTSEQAELIRIADCELIARRNNMPVIVLVDRGMPFTDVQSNAHIWRDLYDLYQKRN